MESTRQNSPVTAHQLEEIQDQARQEGFRQGLREGRDAGLKAIQEQLSLLEALLKSLDEPFSQLDESVERQLAELAMLVARQLVRRELTTDPEQVVSVVREALSALPVAARNVRLALHPEDAALIRETLSLGEADQPFQLIDDPLLCRGGCKVLSDSSQIDASVESRLDSIISHVLGGPHGTDNED